MNIRPARYLLRIDDLCPTMDGARWQRFARLIEEYALKPILAVVPANEDPDLMVANAAPDFWTKMRALEARGATIAVHGYRHVAASHGRSLLPLHRETEFAGVTEERQREWIRSGLEILRGHDLNPRLWVAPRHGFDHGTLRALRHEGIPVLSDGLARVPVVRGGVVWIPQQLWRPAEKRVGLWTILLHTNSATDEMVGQLDGFVRKHARQFTSVDQVLLELQAESPGVIERIYEVCAVARLKGSRLKRRLLRGR